LVKSQHCWLLNSLPVVVVADVILVVVAITHATPKYVCNCVGAPSTHVCVSLSQIKPASTPTLTWPTAALGSQRVTVAHA